MNKYVSVFLRIVLVVFIYLATASLGVGIATLLTDNPQQLLVIGGSIYSALQIAIFCAYLYLRNRKVPDFLSKRRLDFKTIIKIPAVTALLLLASNLLALVMTLLQTYSPLVEKGLQDYEKMFANNFPNPLDPLNILFVVILVPIAEELLFRACILGELRRVVKEPIAVVITALLFSIAHWNLLQSAYTLVAGLFLGFCYIWTGSIYFSILLHMFFNFCGSVLAVLVVENPDFQLPYGIILLILAVAGIFNLIELAKNYRQFSLAKLAASNGEAANIETRD